MCGSILQQAVQLRDHPIIRFNDFQSLIAHFIHDLDTHGVHLLIKSHDLLIETNHLPFNSSNSLIEPVEFSSNAQQLALHACSEAVKSHPVWFALLFHGDSRTSSSPA